MTSDAEQGMAKLCIEFITSDSTQSAPETDFTKILKGNLSDKEINESTPKVSIEYTVNQLLWKPFARALSF